MKRKTLSADFFFFGTKVMLAGCCYSAILYVGNIQILFTNLIKSY